MTKDYSVSLIYFSLVVNRLFGDWDFSNPNALCSFFLLVFCIS